MRRLRSRIVVAVILSAICALVGAQSKPTVTLTGRVIDAVSRQPVRGALVEARGRGVMLVAASGADGRFTLTVEPVQLAVQSIKPGYLNGAYGRRRPEGGNEALELSSAAANRNIELLMWQTATVSGMVTDESGEPMPGVTVSAEGDRGMKAVGAVTDGAGRYSIDGLFAGDYVVGVKLRYGSSSELSGPPAPQPGPVVFPADFNIRDSSSRAFASLTGAVAPAFFPVGGARRSYAGIFYPSAVTASDASVVSVDWGEERSDISLQLPVRPSVRYSGRVMSPEGPVTGASLLLTSAATTAETTTGADGAFTFIAVPQGSYELVTERQIGSALYWERMPVALGDRDVSDVTVVLKAAVTVRGIIALPGGRTADSSTVQVRLVRRGSNGGTFESNTQDRFEIMNVLPDDYVVYVDAPLSLSVEAIESGGRDVLDLPTAIDASPSPLLIRLTDRPASIIGSIQKDAGLEIQHAVVVFPADRAVWERLSTTAPLLRVRSVTPDHGNFAIPNLPPGDYLIDAVDDALLDGWPSARVFARLAGTAQRVHVGPGEQARRALVLRVK